MNLSIGNTLSEIYVVSSADLICEIDDTLPKVLGTYNIVKWSEITSGKILYQAISEDLLSVGMKIDIKHSGISLEGATITISSTVTSIKGPMVSFDIEVKDCEEVVATLSHLRVIMTKEKLQSKIDQKSLAK